MIKVWNQSETKTHSRYAQLCDLKIGYFNLSVCNIDEEIAYTLVVLTSGSNCDTFVSFQAFLPSADFYHLILSTMCPYSS